MDDQREEKGSTKGWIAFVSLFGVSVVLTVLDWTDALAQFHHLNMTAMAAIWGNAVVIAVFGITYSKLDKRRLEIDERRLEKENEERHLIENQRHVTLELIRMTCRTVQESMDELYTREFIEHYVIPKLDLDVALDVDPLFNRAIAIMFEYDAQILESAQAGLLDSRVFIAYEEMKRAARTALNYRITFYDAAGVVEEADRNYKDAMRDLLGLLNEKEAEVDANRIEK